MSSINRGRMLAATLLLLFFTVFNASAASDYHFDMGNVFGIYGQNATNRIIRLQSQSPFAGNTFFRTSSVTGDFWVSNAISYPVVGNVYIGQIQAPPSSISFSFYVPSTNMGTVEAQGYTSIPANGVQTFPAGATAPSFQAALNLFQLSSNGPNGSLSGSQTTNLVVNSTNNLLAYLTNFAEFNTIRADNLILPFGNALTKANSSSNLIAAVAGTDYDTGGAALSIGAAATNYTLAASNSLYSQIGSGGVSLVTVTNVGSNQVWSATNTIGIASGSSAYVSTNRFDVSGAGVTAATAATNGWPWLSVAAGNTVTITNGSTATVIQAAINSLTSSGVVNVQPGNYTINTAIKITNSMVIQGNGATFAYSAGQTGFMFDTGTNYGKPLLINNLRFDGGVYSSYSDSSHHLTDTPGQWFPWLNPCYTNRSALRVESSGGVTIQNCTFFGWPGNGCLAIQQGGTFTAQNFPKFVFRANRCYTNFIGVFATVAQWDVNGYYNAPFGPNGMAPEYALIEQNDCYQNQMGIVASAGNCLVMGNTVNGNYFGLAAFSGGNAQHGNYSVNTMNHNHDAIYFEGNGLGGLFQGNALLANTGITFNAVDAVVFKNNSISQSSLNFTNGTTGSIINNTYEFGAIWGSTDPSTGIATNINPKVLVSGNYSTDGTNNDGTVAAILAHGTNATITGGFAYTPDGTNSAWTRNGYSLTNTSTTNLVGTALTQVTNIAYPADTIVSNALAAAVVVKADTNSPTLFTPTLQGGVLSNANISGTTVISNGNTVMKWLPDGVITWTNNAAPYTWMKFSTNPISPFITYGTQSMTSVTIKPSTGEILSTGPILGNSLGATSWASAFGKSNIVFFDFTGFGRTNDLATFVQSIINGSIGGSAALTNAIGTNFPNGNLVSQTLFYPTNFVNPSSGTATNLTVTNLLSLEANLAFGPLGGATNIYASTNILKVFNAGSSVATNGTLIWNSSLNCYTNWSTGAIYTNSGSAWLLQTNGVTLYTVSGSNPAGTSTAVSGAAPPPTIVVSAYLDGNGFAILGPLSVTNIAGISNALYTNITSITTNNFIANNGGLGTNTTLYFNNVAWGQSNYFVGGAKYGSAIFGGVSNKIDSGGTFSVIAGGYANRLVGPAGQDALSFIGGGWSNYISEAGYSVIAGGRSNTVAGSGSAILGGQYNAVSVGSTFGATDSSILGGNYNLISPSGGGNLSGSSILGGSSNTVHGFYSVAGGHNVTINHDNSFAWSDGTSYSTTSNSQFNIITTNGLNVIGPIRISANNTNYGIFYKSNTFALWPLTNSLGIGDFVNANSNGVPVVLWNSNGVVVMKNLFP